MPGKLLLRRWQCKGAAREWLWGCHPSLCSAPKKRVAPQRERGAPGAEQRLGRPARRSPTGPSCSSRSLSGSVRLLLLCRRQWAASVRSCRQWPAGRARGSALGRPPAPESTAARAAGLGGSSTRSRALTRTRAFPEPLPETQGHPLLTLTPSLFQKPLSGFLQLQNRGRELSAVREGNCLGDLKLRRFPILLVAQVFISS